MVGGIEVGVGVNVGVGVGVNVGVGVGVNVGVGVGVNVGVGVGVNVGVSVGVSVGVGVGTAFCGNTISSTHVASLPLLTDPSLEYVQRNVWLPAVTV
jgi:hypothetical protein